MEAPTLMRKAGETLSLKWLYVNLWIFATNTTAQQLPATSLWALSSRASQCSVWCGWCSAVWCRRKQSLTATRCLSVLVQYKMCDVCNVCSSYETFEGPLVFSVLILWWAAAAIKMQMFAMFANLDSREKEVVDNREERRPYLLTTQAFSWPVERASIKSVKLWFPLT